MNPALIVELKKLLRAGLEDDSWGMDWTAISVTRSPRISYARIFGKSQGIWAGEALSMAAQAVASEYGMTLEIQSLHRDGSSIKKGMELNRWKGETRAVLALERPFLNLASYMGGIAYQTAELVTEVSKAWRKLPKKNTAGLTAPRVTLTRKTLPHYRDLAIHSVILGGGYPHRVSLAGGILIKENHIAIAGSVKEVLRQAREVAPHSLRIEIEVRDLKEFESALETGAEVIMLDNFSPGEVRQALAHLKKVNHKPLIEVSGGITPKTIGAYVLPGIDVISSGSITHSVSGTDLSLLMQNVSQKKK